MQDVCGIPSAAGVRAALADLAERAMLMAVEVDEIGEVSAWQTRAAREFRAETGELAASLRGWQHAATNLRSDLVATGAWSTRFAW